jgi:glycosyltransferase involved in cell wall biosynthesis
MKKISVVIITRNESARLRQALASVCALADEIIVVDDFSDDDTCLIAQKEFGARTFVHRSERNLAGQRNFGADQAAYDWILQMDADEIFPPATVAAIHQALEEAGDIVAFSFMRLNHLAGCPVRHAGAYQSLLRLYRRDKARYREPDVHDHLELQGGARLLAAEIHHFPFSTGSQMIERALFYGEKESALFLAGRSAVSAREIHDQLVWKALKSFWKMYIKKRGYKDGLHGLVWCLCMVIGSQIRWIKIWEKARSEGKLVSGASI